MDKKLFSIIVVALNAEDCIKRTMDSILSQTCNDYEVIVKDGGSTDKTLELIPDNPCFRVYSVKDNSVYQGMNQAIDYVNGRYVIFMNCGDKFYDASVLSEIKNIISERQLDDKCIIYGNYRMKDKDYTQPSVITGRQLLLYGGLCHQSMFFSSDIFDKIGGFDESVKICADYELMVRAFKNSISYEYVDMGICDYEGGGLSEREDMLQQVIDDGKYVRKKYFSTYDRFTYVIFRTAKKIKRAITKG